MKEDSTSSEETPQSEPPASKPRHPPWRRLSPLPFGARLLVLFVGGLLMVIGFAGLLLPGIQGILTLVLGAAILSLASDWVYKLQRRMLTRWPRISHRIEQFRHRVHNWLSRKPGDDRDSEPPAD